MFAVLLGAMIGPAGPPAWRVPLAFLDHLPGIEIDSGVSDAQWSLIWNIRMPRVILAGIVGAMLSVGGAAYQGVFRNPLVDPYLFGAAAGAGLGATLMIAVWGDVGSGWPDRARCRWCRSRSRCSPSPPRTWSAHRSAGCGRARTLVLAGVAMVSLMTAIQTFVLQRNSEVVREVYNWILGRVSTATWSDVRLVTPYVVISCVVLFLHRRHLDMLRVGDEEAATLGMPVGAGAPDRGGGGHARHGGRRRRERPDRVRRG